MKKSLQFVCMTLCLVSVSPIVSEVLDGPRGPVEFIGLEEWTASDLFEAIKETDPDKPFHACAAVMKQSLNFPDAAAFVYFETQEDGSQSLYTVVVGVEEKSHVQYRTTGNDSLDLPKSWVELQTVAEDNYRKLSAAAYARYLLATPENVRKLADLSSEEAEETKLQIIERIGAEADTIELIEKFLDGTTEATDHVWAQNVLAKSESWSARFVAVLVLAHFPNNDASWHGLAESLIDPAPQVWGFASRIIQGLVRAEKAVPVHWIEARDTLVNLLGGTNPFAFNEILNALVATEIDPKFGRELARERSKLLLAFAGAEYERIRTPARSFLKTIRGLDFEGDVEAWSEWINEEELERVP